jgi:hypothetical protein
MAWRVADSYGNTNLMKSDGFGGFRGTHSHGHTILSKPSGFGGFKSADSGGNASRVRFFVAK